ncbi:hypothetical protein VTN00DRAFT_7775 [Thermoascus crustaceus]|uniref:uncharacterized protein n=1 Tax=Thermoascus crustaceus TaxID=5088 RepID=UPI003744142A
MAEQQAVTKKRIVDHMNTDHQTALEYFLQVYCRVAPGAAKGAQMEDISLSDMVITAKRTRYSVPIDPPMQSLLDARHRIVDMYHHCLDRLGLSDITVTEYRAPRGFHAVIFALCLSTYVAFSRRGNFLPGSVFYDALGLARVPQFARFCYTIQPILLPLMVGIHVLEASLLAVKRLRPHRVPFLSGLWCTWMVSVFIEGFGAFQRFDAIVRREKDKKEQRKSN